MGGDLRARVTLGVLAIAAAVLVALSIRPIGVALLLGAILGAVLQPWQQRLQQLVRRPGLAAGLMCLGVVVAILGPITWLTAVLAHEVVLAVHWTRDALRAGGLEEILARLPDGIAKYAREVLDLVPEAGEQIGAVAKQGLAAVGAVGGVVSTTGRLLLQTGMTLIALFFLLIDGHRLVAWLEWAVPLRPGQLRELLEELRKVARAVFISTFATAGIQAAVALVSYVIAGVPQPFFFAFATFIAALIPAVGASICVLLVAALELATGGTGAAIFLAIWGLGVVSIVDNLLKPYFIRGGVEMHGAIVFFALIGGVAAFGPVGLVVGPLGVAFLIAVIRIIRRDYGDGGVAPAVSESKGAAPQQPMHPLK